MIIKRLTKLKDCNIQISGRNCKIIIEENCELQNTSILLYGNGSSLLIRRNTKINGLPSKETMVTAAEGKKIEIGKDSLFSWNVEIHNTDFHPVFDYEGKRINFAKDIYIGDNVWIGSGSKILKGSLIPNNTIIGTGTLINKGFKKENTLIVGNPPQIKKEDITWEK